MADEKGQSQFEKVSGKNAGLAGELVGFLKKNKKWWLLPLMVFLVFFGVMLLLSTTAIAPFIYTFV